MTARFKMDQPGAMPPVVGVYGKATRDIQTGSPVTFTAEDTTHSTYDWEVLTQPQESMVPGPPVTITPVPGTPWLGTATFGHTGGHLIRLTVDAGMLTEDVQVLYMGIRLPVSGLALPALEETIFDNSEDDPAYRGWESKIDAYLKWVDSVIGGGVVTPTGWGRVYIDQLNGSDITGTGSHEKPYASIDFATSTLAPTANPAEFLTPYEFVIAPGYYSSMGGVIRVPFRRKVTFSGRDVVISDQIQWDISPQAWTDVGLSSVVYPPELFFNGEGSSWCALSYSPSVVPESYGPSFRLEGGVNVVNVFPGSAPWVGGQRLHMKSVSAVGIINNSSGGAAPNEATGRLYLYTDECWFGGMEIAPSYDTVIGSVTEPAMIDEKNEIHIYARNTRFGIGLFSSCVLVSMEQCEFNTINRLFDGNLNPSPEGYIGGIIADGDRGPLFRDCEFRQGGGSFAGYVFGWDGATGSLGEPYGPTFDEVSYRSLLHTDLGLRYFAVENITSWDDVRVREGRSQCYVINDVAVDLVNDPGGPFVPLNEYLIPSWNWRVQDTDFADLRSNPERIYITRDGRYELDLFVQVANEQILFDAVVGVGLWRNGVKLPQGDLFVVCVPGFPGAGANANAAVATFDMPLSANDYFEVKTWIKGFFGGVFPISIGIPGLTFRISRYQ